MKKTDLREQKVLFCEHELKMFLVPTVTTLLTLWASKTTLFSSIPYDLQDVEANQMYSKQLNWNRWQLRFNRRQAHARMLMKTQSVGVPGYFQLAPKRRKKPSKKWETPPG